MENVTLLVLELNDNLHYDRNIVGIVDSYLSLIWNEQYYGMDEFELKLPLDTKYVNMLSMGNMLVRSNKRDDNGDIYDNHAMLIETITVSFVEDVGEVLTVSGRGVKSLLSRRVVWNKNVLKGDLQEVFGAMFDSANYISNPNDPNFTNIVYVLDILPNVYEAKETSAFGKKVAEWFMEVCQAYHVGWKVKVKLPDIDEQVSEVVGWVAFYVYEGKDRTSSQSDNMRVTFSKENNNLINFEYKYSMRDYANKIMIAGEGEGVSQSVAEYTYDSNAKGINRFEAYIDGSSVKSDIVVLEPEYLSLLRAYGKEQTNINKVHEFSCNIDPNTTYILGQDYDLGDVVEVETDIGVKAKARIIELIWSYDENGYTVVPTFSDWEVL